MPEGDEQIKEGTVEGQEGTETSSQQTVFAKAAEGGENKEGDEGKEGDTPRS